MLFFGEGNLAVPVKGKSYEAVPPFFINMKQLYLKCLSLGILSLVCITASAYDCKVDGIYYNLNRTVKTASVTFYNSSDTYYANRNAYRGAVTIPSSITYNGITYDVTSIESHAFDECTNLSSIIIPNSVTTIGDYVFYDCNRLTAISIPNSVTKIGAYTFYKCSDLTFITIGNRVTSIGNYAFYGCSDLTSIRIPNGVTTIGAFAFQGCSCLTSVNIPSSVTNIGNNAFYDCSELKDVNITDMDAWCNITFDSASSNPLCYSNNLYLNNEHVTDLNISSKVTAIRNYAFYGCSGLTSISISNSVSSIGENTFGRCSGLTSVSIPNSVSNIGASAFSGCTNLAAVYSYITDVFEIHPNVFSNCANPILYVPKGLIDTYRYSMGWHMFQNIREMDVTPDDYDDSPTIALQLCCNSKGIVTINEASDFSNKMGIVNIFENKENTFVFTPKDNCKLEQVSLNGFDITTSVENYTLKTSIPANSQMVVTFSHFSCDINSDGCVDISDVVSLVNIILGQ